MCTVCGCGEGETRIEGEGHDHTHRRADGTVHSHPHEHSGEHVHDHDHAGMHRHADGTVHRHAPEHAPAAVTAYRPVPSRAAPGHAPGGDHYHRHPDGTWHSHAHDPVNELGPARAQQAELDYGAGPAGAHAPGLSQARMVRIEQDILSKNNAYAGENRKLLADRGVFAVNLVSSPGSGKTTLLVRTIEALKGRRALAVIEGDQQTSVDAERIRATGARAIQVNTGKGCHLDAHMVGSAIGRLGLADDSLLLIENVGNLVCPADFDLGEAHKVVILSVTEGEDKPLKYPNMFRAADLMLVNKVDLLPHLDFDIEKCIAHARQVNPRIAVMRVSARSGEGMDAWLAWLEAGVAEAGAARARTVEALRRRVAELEARLAARPA